MSFLRYIAAVALLGANYLVEGRGRVKALEDGLRKVIADGQHGRGFGSSSGDASPPVFAVHPTELRTRFVEFQYAALLCELHRALAPPAVAGFYPTSPGPQDFEACLAWAERALDLNDSTAIAREFITPLMDDIEAYLMNEAVVNKNTRRVVVNKNVAPIATSPGELMESLAKLENVGGWFRVPPGISGFDVPVFRGHKGTDDETLSARDAAEEAALQLKIAKLKQEESAKVHATYEEQLALVKESYASYEQQLAFLKERASATGAAGPEGAGANDFLQEQEQLQKKFQVEIKDQMQRMEEEKEKANEQLEKASKQLIAEARLAVSSERELEKSEWEGHARRFLEPLAGGVAFGSNAAPEAVAGDEERSVEDNISLSGNRQTEAPALPEGVKEEHLFRGFATIALSKVRDDPILCAILAVAHKFLRGVSNSKRFGDVLGNPELTSFREPILLGFLVSRFSKISRDLHYYALRSLIRRTFARLQDFDKVELQRSVEQKMARQYQQKKLSRNEKSQIMQMEKKPVNDALDAFEERFLGDEGLFAVLERLCRFLQSSEVAGHPESASFNMFFEFLAFVHNALNAASDLDPTPLQQMVDAFDVVGDDFRDSLDNALDNDHVVNQRRQNEKEEQEERKRMMQEDSAKEKPMAENVDVKNDAYEFFGAARPFFAELRTALLNEGHELSSSEVAEAKCDAVFTKFEKKMKLGCPFVGHSDVLAKHKMRLHASSPVTKVPSSVVDRPPTTVMIDPVGFRFSMNPNCVPTAIVMRVLIESLTESRAAWAFTPGHWWGYVEIPEAARKFLSGEIHGPSGEIAEVTSPCPTGPTGGGIGFMDIDVAQYCVGSVDLLNEETVPKFAEEYPYRKECASACRGPSGADEKSPQFCAIENARLRSNIYALHRKFFLGENDLTVIFQNLVDEPPTGSTDGRGATASSAASEPESVVLESTMA